MTELLKAISDGWSWKLGKPVDVIATNPYGNVLVKNAHGKYYRIIPEELQCDYLAASLTDFEAIRAKEEFRKDWQMADLVSRAELALGSLTEGQCYHLVIPGVLGGQYTEDNIRMISLHEWVACSGDMARQIDGLPDGTEVEIKISAEPSDGANATLGAPRSSS